MLTTTYTHTRQNLATIMDNVINNRTPIMVTRQQKEPVVIISLNDFKSMEETAYLMQSSTNAQRLNQAISELENGFGIQRELIEDE